MAMKDRMPAQDDPAQSQRFIDMAKEVSSTGDLTTFEHVLTKMGKLRQSTCETPKKSE